MDLLGSILNNMDAPPSSSTDKAVRKDLKGKLEFSISYWIENYWHDSIEQLCQVI